MSLSLEVVQKLKILGMSSSLSEREWERQECKTHRALLLLECCSEHYCMLSWYCKRASVILEKSFSLLYAPGLENRHLYQTDKGLSWEDLS